MPPTDALARPVETLQAGMTVEWDGGQPPDLLERDTDMHYRLAVPLLFAALAAAPTHSQTPAPAPRTIGFMGILNDPAGGRKNGELSVRLALYNAPTGGDALWSESQTVTVSNGLFTAALGAVNPFAASVDFARALFVGVTVEGDAKELLPRMPLLSVPYAMYAHAIADGSVTPEKVSPGAEAGQVLTYDGSKVLWQQVPPPPPGAVIRPFVFEFTPGTGKAVFDPFGHPVAKGCEGVVFAWWNGMKRPFSTVAVDKVFTLELGRDPDGVELIFEKGDQVEGLYYAQN